MTQDRVRAAHATRTWLRACVKGAFCAGLLLGLCGEGLADPANRWGEYVAHAYEIADTGAIDLFDGSLSDWRVFAPGPSIRSSEFHGYQWEGGAFEDHRTDPGFTDLVFEVWLGWRADPPRVYVGLSRSDDLHVPGGAPAEGGPTNLAAIHDGLEFMIDGDHNGGQYAGFFSPGDQHRRMRNAQGYSVFLDSLRVLHRQIWLPTHWRPEGHWANALPYSAGGGALDRSGSGVLEFYVTPFDTLRGDPATSRLSELTPGKVVGIDINVFDADDVLKVDLQARRRDTHYSLAALGAGGESYASFLVDVQLLPAGGTSAARATSWGTLKASIRRDR